MTLDESVLVAGLDAARVNGARGCEILAQRSVRQRVVIDGDANGAPSRPVQHELVTVRVWLEGGRAGAASGRLGKQGVEPLVTQAITAAAAASVDAHAGPTGRLSGASAGLAMLDRRHATVSADDRLSVVLDSVRGAQQACAGASLRAFGLDDTLQHRYFVSSRGLQLSEVGTVWRLWGSLTAPSSDVPVSLGADVTSRTFASVASLPLGTRMGRLAQQLTTLPAARPAGPVRVVLMPPAVASLFGSLAELFTEENVRSGKIFFGQSTAEVPVVSERLHLVDDGGLPGALRTSAFDDRGVPPVPLTLLRDGCVGGFFVDPERAHALGVRPTGHVSGDGSRAGNLALRAGTRSVNAMLSDLGGETLVIDSLPDLAGVNWLTGAVKLSAHALVYQGNKPVGAARGVRLTGDLSMVLKQVVEVLSDTDRVGHVDAPAICVEGFSVV